LPKIKWKEGKFASVVSDVYQGIYFITHIKDILSQTLLSHLMMKIRVKILISI